MLLQYSRREACTNKAIMICKSCTSEHLEGVSVFDAQEEYQVWCFSSGNFTTLVSPLYTPDYTLAPEGLSIDTGCCLIG